MNPISNNLLNHYDYIASITLPEDISRAAIKNSYLIKVSHAGDFISAHLTNIMSVRMESNMADKNISISLISNLDIPQHVYNARAIISSTTNDMRFDYAENILPPYPTITNETLAQRDSAIAIAKDIFVNTARGAIDSLSARKQTSDGVTIKPLKRPKLLRLPENILFPIETGMVLTSSDIDFEIPELPQQSLDEINSKKAEDLVNEFLKLEPTFFNLT